MSVPAHNLQLSAEEYLKLEESSQVRHEYLSGRVFAMVGATEAHNTIVSNLFLLIGSSIRGSGCRTFVADMKIRVEAVDSFYYPDLMVTCEPFLAGSLFKSSPSLIAEVLSPSTAEIDRREKLLAYRTINALRYYAIVYQDQRKIELYQKIMDGQWRVSVHQGRDSLTLAPAESGDMTLCLDDVYDGVIDA